jgi:membrane associated rhomboid family serine protease
MAFKKKMYLTNSLIITNVIIFIYTFIITRITPSIISLDVYIPYHFDMAFYPLLVYFGNHPASVILSLFSHSQFSFLHIIGNMIFLFFLGPGLEERVGKINFLIIYLISGIGGHIFFVLFLTNPLAGGLGASGALSGIVAALMVLYPRDKLMMPIPLGPLILIRRVNTTIAGLAFLGYQVFAMLFGGFSLTADVSGEQVAYSAHIGGFIFGMALSPLIVARDPKIKVKHTPPKKTDFSELEPLATTEELQKALELIKKEDEPEVRQAWLEHFVSKTNCLQCGSHLSLEGHRIVCSCGFKAKF